MFMNLNSEWMITQTSWTPLPMPRHVANQVHQIADTQP